MTHATPNLPATPAPSPCGTQKERSRRPSVYPRLARNLDPAERLVTANGKPAVSVELSGGKAGGASMLLDRDTWAWIAESFGKSWTVMGDGCGNVYVASGRRQVASAAGQSGANPVALLARLIAGRTIPLGTRVVRFRNANTFDLRDDNLVVMTREEAKRWRPTDAPAEVHPDHA